MRNIVIGIEGLVGSGKTSICRELLNSIPNSILLQGGNLYRAIVFVLISSGISLENLMENMKYADVMSIMEELKITFDIENRDTVIYFDGKKINEVDIQSINSSLAVSEVINVADNQNLYLFARTVIDNLKEKFNVIVSARDLMRVYPDLDYHFFITASLEERVRRKSIQYDGKVDLVDLEKNIVKRDALHEKAGFHNIYDKTIVVDVTDCSNVFNSTQEVFKYINLRY